MSIPRKHHFIPQFQLEYFKDCGGVWHYDLVKDKLQNIGVPNLAAESYLYAWKKKDGSKDMFAEEFLSKIESGVAPIIRKIHNLNFNLDNEERSLLSFYIALQMQRTPTNRERTKQFVEGAVKKVMKFSALSSEHFQEMSERVVKENPDMAKMSKSGIEKARNMFLEEDYDLGVPPEYFIRFMIENSRDIARHIHEIGWRFMVAPHGAQFVISDDPYVMYRPRDKDTPFWVGPGIKIMGTEITLPITPKVCLFMSPSHVGVSSLNVGKKAARQINKRTAMNCRRFVYGGSEALVKNLAKQLKLHHRGMRTKLAKVDAGF